MLCELQNSPVAKSSKNGCYEYHNERHQSVIHPCAEKDHQHDKPHDHEHIGQHIDRSRRICRMPHTHPHVVEKAQSANPRIRYKAVSGSGAFRAMHIHRVERAMKGTVSIILKSIFP